MSVQSVADVSYASAEVAGKVDPADNDVYYWFQYTLDPAGDEWVNGPEIFTRTLAAGSGEANVAEVFTGLKGGTEYKARLVAFRIDESEMWTSEAPYVGFTTLPVDPPAVVSIEDASGISYTGAKVKGAIERPANVDPAFDASCHFEYVSDQQFTENQGNGAPAFEGAGSVPCELATPGEDPVKTPGESEVSANLTGLGVGTAYHLRLNVSNAGGSDSKEAAGTFTTLTPAAPSVSIDSVTTFTDTTAHFSGHVNPGGTDPAFNVHWEFRCNPDCPGFAADQPGIGDIAADADPHEVQAEAIDLEPNTTYEVELTATNAAGPKSAGPESFKTTGVAPRSETLPAFSIEGGTEALVGGRINPRNSASVYWIEYGTTTGYESSAPVTEDASAGTGGTGQIFTQRIDGLAPSTVYHFRVVAKNATGQSVGRDMNFETAPAGPVAESCPNDVLRTENNSSALPDCRAYEKVSPADKNGFDAGANGAFQQANYVASDDGSALAFESFGAFGDAQAASLLNEYISRRRADGWTTHGLTPGQKPGANTAIPAFRWFSPDLRYAMLQGGNTGSLAPGDNPSLSNFYLRDNTTDTYQTLNLGGTVSGYEVAGGSVDGRRMFFQTGDALTPDAVAGANVYEWNEGNVKLASIRLNSAGEEEPSPEGARVPVNTERHYNQVSKDGARVIFFDNQDQQLYLREDGIRTLRVSDSQREAPDPDGPATVYFGGASADGSKIFFLTSAMLTDESKPGIKKLYLYDVDTETVTDLTASALPELALGVEGVAAVSASGEYVYFRSSSRFNPGDNQPGRSALYVWHNGAISFIASDEGDGDFATQGYYTHYRVSPNGQSLSFDTTNQLTSYDNTDSVPAGDGSAREDREVYIYDAVLNRLTCVSCNPSGARPTGAPNDGPAAESFVPEPSKRQYYNLQPGVGDDGHLFFNSRDALVPQDVNGRLDVYEWENGRVHLISAGTGESDSFVASSSLSGNDVFFQTRERLIGADRDENEDIYDARVGGGFPEATPSSPCRGLECHGPASSAPQIIDPVSGDFSSPLKPTTPSARRLQKALKACRHKPKKARTKCRVAAKKRYGKTSSGRVR